MKMTPTSGEELSQSAASADVVTAPLLLADADADPIPVAEPAPAAAGPSAPPKVTARPRPGAVRRVPKPRMTGMLDSPVRNLTFGVDYVVVVMILATLGYMATGWSFRDAIYMVVVTVYTVGYGE